MTEGNLQTERGEWSTVIGVGGLSENGRRSIRNSVLQAKRRLHGRAGAIGEGTVDRASGWTAEKGEK